VGQSLALLLNPLAWDQEPVVGRPGGKCETPSPLVNGANIPYTHPPMTVLLTAVPMTIDALQTRNSWSPSRPSHVQSWLAMVNLVNLVSLVSCAMVSPGWSSRERRVALEGKSVVQGETLHDNAWSFSHGVASLVEAPCTLVGRGSG